MIPYPQAIHDSWLPLCALKDIARKPLRRLLHGHPLVIFAGADGPVVMRDRCPHRNVPLSDGWVEDGAIVCPYHGWAFDQTGTCTKMPGTAVAPGICAEVMPVRCEAGIVFSTTSESPRDFAPLPTPLGDDSFDHHIWTTSYRGSLIDGMENLLDPFHPHLMHPRIVGRNPQRVQVDVERRSGGNMVECIYHEQARRRGWLPALLEGARLQGTGRISGPTTCQLGFLGPDGPKLYISVIFTPHTVDHIQTLAVFSTPKGRLPAWIKGWTMVAFNRKILKEDQVMIARQLDNVHSFGAPRYRAAPMDYIRPGMIKLMEGETLAQATDHFTCWL